MRNKIKTIIFIVACLVIISGITFAEVTKIPEAMTFVQLCDPQLGFGGYEHDVNSLKLAVQKINELKADVVVICGDMINTFDEKSISDFNDIISDLKMPYYCCPGNHDVGNTPTVESLNKYRKYFGKDYYTFGSNIYTFIVTNTNLWKTPVEGESEKQDEWIKEALATAYENDKSSPIFVIGHHPLYMRNPDEPVGNNSLPVEKRKELLELFEKNGVKAVLTAHTHQMVINDYKGIQLVTGETTSRNLDGRPFGFRLWKVSPDSVKHEFVSLVSETSAVSTASSR